MFHKEFYPTPKDAYLLMQVNCTDKIILEPQAGKGDLVNYMLEDGAKEVLAYEKNKDLQKIVESKCRLMGSDFFDCKAEDISHIDAIVMNPPFSNAEKHIEHAFEIAPEGCEITALCNYETIDAHYGHAKFQALIKNYGTADSLGNCFDTSERKTNVEVGLVKLYKPLLGDNRSFEGFFMDEEEEVVNQVEGIMKFSEVRALVNRYVGAVKIFDELDKIKDKLTYTTDPLGLGSVSFTVGFNDKITTKEEFAKHLQKVSWNFIFDKMNMKKYVTKGVMEGINKFVERQHNIPFSERNVYHMLNVIFQTRQQNFDKAIVEVIDNYTKHTPENRFGVEGWVTNESHMLNKKFIIDYMVEKRWSGDNVDLKYSQNNERLTDLIKVLCNLVGKNFDDIPNLELFFRYNDREEGDESSKSVGLKTSKWYDWGFFEFKVFKKGTMHLKFKNIDDWYMLNQAYGKIKGFTLPEKFKK